MPQNGNGGLLMAATMWLWIIVTVRLLVLTSERITFHGLGRGRSAIATTAVAYGGATVVLWIFAFLFGQGFWLGQAFWPGAVYAVSFMLYTASLSQGPVSVVSAFANAATIMLFLVHPTGSLLAWGFIALFAIGSLVMGGVGRGWNRSVWLMLLSDVLLVVGRLFDSHHTHLPPFAYAASLFTAVSLWLSVPLAMTRRFGDVKKLVKGRLTWAMAASLSNGLAYLTVFELLRRMPPSLVEAVSALAGVGATVAGVIWFHEKSPARKIVAASLMTLATVGLLYDHRQGIG